MAPKFYEVLAADRKDLPDLQRCISNTVDQLLKLDTSAGRPGILLGKIQSGKTRAFLGVIADAFDKGYEVAVVLTKGTVSLAEQTIRRIEKDFGPLIQADRVQVFDIMSLPSNLTKYHLSQKIILVVKKEDDNLKRLIAAFKTQYPQLSSRKLLIIDDEADFASVTFRKLHGEVSPGVISQKIDELRALVKNSSFLQVTATPYSLYLQPDQAVLRHGQQLFKPKRPAFTELLPIHSDYVGGDYYFEKSSESESPAYYFYEEVPMPEREALKKPDGRRLNIEQVLTEKNVKVLRRGVMNFVVGAAVRRLQQEKAQQTLQKYSLLVHTEQSREAHSWQESIITGLRDQLESAAASNSPAFQQLFADSYSDISVSVKVAKQLMPEFREVEDSVRDALTGQFLQITKVNSDGDVRDLLDSEGQLKLSTPMNLFIGGQILDRGVTIRNLIGFYYGRNPQKYQQDTVLQHSRMYGARPQADLPVTRLYAPLHIYQVMQKIHQFDSALREGFLNNEYDHGVYFIRRDATDNLIPCSPNRLFFSKLTSLRPGGRLLPVGFQTVYKSYGRKTLEKLDELMDKVYGRQYGKAVVVSLDTAKHMLGLAFSSFEYDASEDYDDERKGIAASLEHLSLHTKHPQNRAKVTIIAHADRDIERLRQDGRISNSPDSYQEKAIARQAANDMPALLMLRQNGKEEKGWRDLPFWWPVIFVPQTAVPSVFAAETPADESGSGDSNFAISAASASAYIGKHLGKDPKWLRINEAIWKSLAERPNQGLRLSDIHSLADRLAVQPTEFLAVLGLLCGPDSGLLGMTFVTDTPQPTPVANSEVMSQLSAWWRNKSITDEEWRSWARGILVEWSPATGGERLQ